MNSIKIILIISIILLSNFLNLFSSNDKHNHSHKCGLSLILNPDSKEKLQRALFLNEDDTPKVGQKSFISKNNLFKIHYDTIGFNAPSLIDNDKNGTPDYIDSVAYYFENAYKVQVEEIGYLSPIPDGGRRGSDHYDVYIWDLGNSNMPNEIPYDDGGLYGLTMPTEQDIIAYEPFQRSYSYIVLDNNYSPTDSVRKLNGPKYPAYKETGINALKITAAHEFQHAIQFIYGIPEPAALTMMEMCGVAMEFRTYPESKDYLQYVKNIFSNLSVYPFGKDSQDGGYGYSIFAKYILQNYGDNILKNMWELVGQNIEVYKAMDSSFTLNNLNFFDEWNKFLTWIYYTGDRAIEGQYFENASELPEIKFDYKINYTEPSISTSYNAKSFEIGTRRIIIKGDGIKQDDTLDIIFTNTDLKDASRQYGVSREAFYVLTSQEGDGRILLDKLGLYLGDESDKEYIQTHLIQKPGVKPVSIDYAFPNPYNPNIDEDVYFPAPNEANIYDNATLTIYNTEMLPLLTIKGKIGVSNGKRVISVEKLDLQSGVYIYGVHTKDAYSIGKISIIRK